MPPRGRKCPILQSYNHSKHETILKHDDLFFPFIWKGNISVIIECRNLTFGHILLIFPIFNLKPSKYDSVTSETDPFSQSESWWPSSLTVTTYSQNVPPIIENKQKKLIYTRLHHPEMQAIKKKYRKNKNAKLPRISPLSNST